MCVFLFGQQEYSPAIEHCKKATKIAPTYSTPYNNLGYLYRQVEDYPSAEQAFKKYIELIPNDPNPYDSYAELLLKMGRYDDSVTQYRKALSVNPQFSNSHFGIASNLLYLRGCDFEFSLDSGNGNRPGKLAMAVSKRFQCLGLSGFSNPIGHVNGVEI